MRVCVLPLVIALAGSACGHWQPARRADREQEQAAGGETGAVTAPAPAGAPATRPAASRPAIGDRAGLDALQRWTKECYELGLRHNPVFARGGQLLILWQADRLGRLLSMDFAVDSFRGWAINSQGETLADCVVARAREAPVSWSQTGSAPLRLQPER